MYNLKVQRWIPIEWIELTNPNVDREIVEKIKANFDGDLFGAIPGIFTKDRKFRITDGNHRVTAFREMRKKYVPMIILTDAEYLEIAYSENTIDFKVKCSMDVFHSFPDAAISWLEYL